MTSACGSVDLKIGISKCAGANCFSPCHFLLQQWLLCASLTVEYPSESAPSLSSEDGGKFPAPPLAGCCLGGLPLGQEPGTLRDQLPPSSSCPIHAVLGRVPPTRGGMESDSLDIMWGTGWSGCSAQDLWCCLSDMAMALHQPSTSGRRMTMK